MNLSGIKVLVTGGAGFIGSHLVDALIDEGCSVRVIDNLSNGKMDNLRHNLKKPGFEFFPGTITDPYDVAIAVKDIDVIFHLACLGVRHSISHPFENHRVNAEGTLFVLQEALKGGVKKLVHCSSSEVYGTAGYVPMPETHPTNPCTVYGASKLAAESYARAYYKAYGLKTVIVRPFNTYGLRSHHEGDAGEFIPKTIVRALNNNPILIFGDGSQARDFTYVEDIARALVAGAKCDDLVGGTFNIGSDFEMQIKELAQTILSETGSESAVEYTGKRPGDVLRLWADSASFRSKTGWHPTVSISDGLKRTVQWFRSRPEGESFLLEQEKGINWE